MAMISALLLLSVIQLCKAEQIGYCLSGDPVTTMSANHYFIFGANKIRPDGEYKVGIALDPAEEPLTSAKFRLDIRNTDGNYTLGPQFVTLTPDEPNKIISFDTKDLQKGNFQLVAEGLEGMVFKETSKNLNFDHKTLSMFVQSDKAIYKPGQEMKFRVVVVNPELQPQNELPLDIHIEDTKRNRLKQWNNVTTTNGIFAGSMQLSTEPVLGDWTLTVKSGAHSVKKTLTVAEYVLPKVEVTIQLPKYATFNESRVVAGVKAKYTYGKNVRGSLLLKAEKTGWQRSKTIFEFRGPINGLTNVEIDLVKELGLNERERTYDQEVKFDAEVVDALTKEKYVTTSNMKIHVNPIKMELVKTSNTFKPGLQFTAFVKVSTQDDVPVMDLSEPVELIYSFDSRKEQSMNLNLTKGMARVDLYPANNRGIERLNMKAKYKGISYYLDNVNAARSPSNTFIQLTKSDDEPATIGSNVVLNVNSTKLLNRLSYQVVAKGKVIMSRTETINPPSKCFSMRVEVTDRMVPSFRVLAHTLYHDNEELIADAINIVTNGLLKTPVKVTANKETVAPSEDVEITVESKPDAQVYVLGVDQSVLLLKSGNDLSRSDVEKEISGYDSGSSRPAGVWRSSWWMNADSAGELFRESGVVLISNAFVYKDHPNQIMPLGTADGSDYFDDDIAESALVRGAPSPALAKSGGGLDLVIEGEVSIPLVVRSKFPETWLWDQSAIRPDGKAVFNTKIPDTITSWMVSAFAMDSESGLGIADDKAKVTVFRPFFVTLNLPYSIIREEAIAVQVLVFNYQDEDVDAEVVMDNSLGQFEFTEIANEVESTPSMKTASKKSIKVPANDGVTVPFLITPVKNGFIDIKVTATGSNSAGAFGDGLIKKLLVKPEGQTIFGSKAFFVDLRSQVRAKREATSTKSIDIEIPDDIVPESEYVAITAIGDILGTTLNSGDLLKMPYGCGEQNMINFVPNIVTMNYLTKSGRLMEAQKEKATKNMEAGYQRELRYQRNDGSFSAFGNNDLEGSTFLTAYVMKSFKQAEPFVTIDKKVMEMGTNWLMARQSDSGTFTEPGAVHHRGLLGGLVKSPAALTAYIMIALAQDEANLAVYSSEIEKSVAYLLKELESTSDAYEVSITTYALHLLENSAKDSAFEKLMSMAKTSSGFKWWGTDSEASASTEYGQRPTSNDVEMTGYALSTMMLREVSTEEAIPVLKWLLSQQNENGGFSSTQDTVIGIQALADIASAFSNNETDLNIRYKTNEDVEGSMSVSGDNSLVLHKDELTRSTRSVDIEAEGSGIAVAQVNYHYNVKTETQSPPFDIKTDIKIADKRKVHQQVCIKRATGQPPTGMAVMEIDSPSGYTISKKFWNVKGVKRTDTENAGTKLVIYFDSIGETEICLDMVNYREHKVAKQKPIPIYAYDYYNRNLNTRVFYQIAQTTLCEICSGDECQKCPGQELPMLP